MTIGLELAAPPLADVIGPAQEKLGRALRGVEGDGIHDISQVFRLERAADELHQILSKLGFGA